MINLSIHKCEDMGTEPYMIFNQEEFEKMDLEIEFANFPFSILNEIDRLTSNTYWTEVEALKALLQVIVLYENFK